MSRADLANKVYQIFLRDRRASDVKDVELCQQIALSEDEELIEFINTHQEGKG